MENIKITATDGLSLSCLYSKAENPRAICQIMHGMAEHKERYVELIEALNKSGITVIISDMRGHGESINEEYSLGHIGGDLDLLVSDQYEVTKWLKKHNPNLPMYVFSHSMGTLVSRAYIEKHDDEIERLIMSGTVGYQAGVWLGVFLAKCKSIGKGAKKYSKLLWAMSNGASFDPSLDWLSYSKKNIENYTNDPLCGFKFTNASNKVLFTLTNNLHKRKRYQCKNPTLRIYSISGEDDRTTGGEKGLKDTMKSLLMAGYIDMKYKTYPKMKHEILMEDDHKEVIEDILKFYQE
jgi:alpha-beta hydrolase superfamily lysophospholipase